MSLATITMPPWPLTLAGAGLLAIGAGAMLLLIRIDAAVRATARTQAVLRPYQARPSTRPDLGPHLPQWRAAGGAWRTLARLFGMDAKRLNGCAPRPGVVLPATLAAAAALGWLVPGATGLPAWVPVPVLWICFSRATFGFLARRRRDRLFQQFPDVLAMVVRALRVGQTVTEALRSAAANAPEPSGAVFVRLVERLAIGMPLGAALPHLAEDAGLSEYRFFCTALLLQSRSGGSLTETLDTMAEVIRGRVALRRRAFAMSSEARTSAIVLAVLPVLTFLGMLILAPAYEQLLLQDSLGRRMLAGAVAMLLAGGVIMRGMVRRLHR